MAKRYYLNGSEVSRAEIMRAAAAASAVANEAVLAVRHGGSPEAYADAARLSARAQRVNTAAGNKSVAKGHEEDAQRYALRA